MTLDAGQLRACVAAHRAKTSNARENSISGLKQLSKLCIPYIEVDVRSTSDGQFVLLHDRAFRADDGNNVTASLTPLMKLQALAWNGAPIDSLDSALRYFAQNVQPETSLCIDVKEYGHELELLKLIRVHQLDHRIIFISWIPQVLEHLAALGFKGPLVLSHWNVQALGLAGRLAARTIKFFRLPFRGALIVGEGYVSEPAPDGDIRLLAAALPLHLTDLLRGSGGGVCVPQFLYGERLAAYVAKSGLKLWLYAAKSPRQFLNLAGKPQVDVILCEDAAKVSENLANCSR